MKLNTKNILSAALFIGVALVGLWINGGLFGLGIQEHSLGSARRMGPGYMPMLAFWLQIILGGLVLFAAFFNGPDPLATWTTPEIVFLIGGALAGLAAGYIAAGLPGFASSGWNPLGIGLFVGSCVASVVKSWRPLFLVSAAFTLFGLVLEPIGFIVAIAGSVLLSAVADETHFDKDQSLVGWAIYAVLGSVVVLAVLYGIVEGVTWLLAQVGPVSPPGGIVGAAGEAGFVERGIRRVQNLIYNNRRAIALVMSIAAAVLIMFKGERLSRAVSAAGLVGFLCILCDFVFIYGLDIRVPVWPQL